MAFKTVVVNNFVEAIGRFLRVLAAERGDLNLAMLVPAGSGLSDKWNFVLSAKWIDGNGLQAAIPSISSLLRTHVSKNNAARIERISVLRTSDLLVTDLMSLDISLGTAYRVDTLALSLRNIEDAIVLIARKTRSQTGSNFQTVKNMR